MRCRGGDGTDGESAAAPDDACMPPESPYRISATPGIPDPKPVREILNKDEEKYEDGYDTEGEKGPFYDAVEDELAAPIEADQVDHGLPTSMGGDGTDTAAPSNEEPDWFLGEDAVKKMKAEELKDAIRRRGVVAKGKKGELQDMLRECVAKKLPIVEGGPTKDAAALGGFPVGSKWNMLVPLLAAVPDPVNEFAFRPPTLGEGESPTTPKHNYAKRFDRPVFTGKNSKGEVRLKGEPRMRFI